MAFSLNDLNSFDVNEMGELPWPVKWIIIAVICVLILGAGFWFLNRPQLDDLSNEQGKEDSLRTEFELKQTKAVSLDAYKKQIVEISQKFGELLHKLPSKTEVPGLLEDISAAGVSSGLRFVIFKPRPEVRSDFYAELPIEIQVVGTYHQLGRFVSKLGQLERIVTVNDFSIGFVPNNGQNKAAVSTDLLNIRLIAKTYRYRDERELK